MQKKSKNARARTREGSRLAEQGQLASVKRSYFYDYKHELPIAKTPAPKPCPFCGVTDVAIYFDVGEHSSAHAQCENCGTEAPFACEDHQDEAKRGNYWLAMEAARIWNTRGGAR
ncbi:MAG: hypothetical protein IRZ28_01455 [Steroidobacteraceae bacterium]|nr:hypothetical protein [Steroidobacteraceae bacterium]